mgnify:CR=1 FL=1
MITDLVVKVVLDHGQVALHQRSQAVAQARQLRDRLQVRNGPPALGIVLLGRDGGRAHRVVRHAVVVARDVRQSVRQVFGNLFVRQDEVLELLVL